MAVPAITDVAPASGPSGGRVLVTIEGADFRLPPTPSAYGPTIPPGPSVRVEFGTVAAERVWVINAVQLLVLTPATNPGVHAVTVTNVDEDGNDIAGEAATAVDAYTTKRPDLTVATPLDQVNRTLRRELARQVLENTSMVTHTEYDSDTGDELSIIDTAALPSISLLGPKLRENRFQSDNERAQVDLGSGIVGEQRNKATNDLLYTAVGASDSTAELINLMAHFEDFFSRNIYLSVQRDFDDADSEFVEFELALESKPETASTPNISNVRHFTAEIVVRGVDCEPGDMVTSRTVQVADLASANPEQEPRAWIEWVVEQHTADLEQ